MVAGLGRMDRRGIRKRWDGSVRDNLAVAIKGGDKGRSAIKGKKEISCQIKKGTDDVSDGQKKMERKERRKSQFRFDNIHSLTKEKCSWCENVKENHITGSRAGEELTGRKGSIRVGPGSERTP